MIDFTRNLQLVDQEWFFGGTARTANYNWRFSFGGVAGAPGADWTNAKHYCGPHYPVVEAMRIEAVVAQSLRGQAGYYRRCVLNIGKMVAILVFL